MEDLIIHFQEKPPKRRVCIYNRGRNNKEIKFHNEFKSGIKMPQINKRYITLAKNYRFLAYLFIISSKRG